MSAQGWHDSFNSPVLQSTLGKMDLKNLDDKIIFVDFFHMVGPKKEKKIESRLKVVSF